MSKAEDLLNSLTEEEKGAVYTISSNEPHIVVGLDRFITVPDQIKKIGVQYDHDIETITFDCPRFWDGNDLSTMKIYINYMREDGHVGMYLCDIVSIEDDIMHFNWTISGEVTQIKGTISFLVCIKRVDSDGNEERHWNSELCQDLYVSEGMECQESILYRYPDIITQLLTRMDITEFNTSKEEILNRINEAFDTNDTVNQTIKDKTVDYLESEITSKDLIVELPVGKWTKQYDNEYTQTVVIDGVDASINPIVSLFYSGEEATDDELNAYTCLSEVTTLDNAIKFVAIEKPSITFSVIVKGLTGVLLSDSIRLLIADKWSDSKGYKHGDYCIYNDTLWRCDYAGYNTVIGEAPSDTSTTWSKVSVSDILKNLSFASNILSSLTSNDFDYSGGPTQIGAPQYTVNESLKAIANVLKKLDNDVFNCQPKGDYAAANHNHNGVYQPKGDYAAARHSHGNTYVWSSNDDDIMVSHNQYGLNLSVNGQLKGYFALVSHSDDRYLRPYYARVQDGYTSHDSNHYKYTFTAPLKGAYLFIVNFRPVACASSCRLKIGSTSSDPIGGVTNVPQYAFDSFPATEYFNNGESKTLLFEVANGCNPTIRMSIIKVGN